MGPTGIAVHKEGGPGPHTAVRVSAEEQTRLRTGLDDLGIEWEEHDRRPPS
jgi:hypothetical protein